MATVDEEKVPFVKMSRKQSNQAREISRSFKIFLTFWAFVENGLFSGLRAGWSAFVYILKQERIYAYLCSDDSTGNFSAISTTVQVNYETVVNTVNYNSSNHSIPIEMNGCDKQDAVFNQCFTVATATMALSALLYGHLNYKYGIRAPRILSVIIFVGGACCFAFVNEDLPWLVYPGLLLISSGGMALYITNNQISYMFTTGSAAVVGLLCGALEASAIVQTIIKILYGNGISIFISYLTLAGLYTLTLISTFCFLPKDYVSTQRVTDISNNSVTAEDEESGEHEETLPIAENDELIIETKYGSADIVNSIKRSGTIITEPGNITDLVDTNNKVDNGTDLSTSADTNELFSQTNDEKYPEISRKDTGSSGEEATPDHQSFHNVIDTQNIDKDITDQYDIKSSEESDENIQKQNAEVNSIPSLQSKVEIHGEIKNVKTIETKKSHAHKNGKVIEKTLLKCLLTKTFLLYLFWAAAVQIILSMSLGTFNPWLEYVTNNDQSQVSELTDILFYSMLGSPILALGFGVAMDALKRPKPNDNKLPEERTLHTATISLTLTSVLGVLLCGLIMTCNDEAVIATCIALVIFRTGLYSCGTAFLRIMYPTQYFGILCGIMSVLSGGISFVQYPLFLWVQDRNQAWIEVFGFIGIIGIVSLVQPAYLYWKSRVFRKENYPNKRNETIFDGVNVQNSGVQEKE